MSEWNFLYKIIKDANKSAESKKLLKDIFNEATHDVKKMKTFRRRLDPNSNLYNPNFMKEAMKNEENYLPRKPSLIELYADEDEIRALDDYFGYVRDSEPINAQQKASADYEFYKDFKEQKNYLNPEYRQEIIDNGYRDFIDAIKDKVKRNNDVTSQMYNMRIARDYLLDRAKKDGYVDIFEKSFD